MHRIYDPEYMQLKANAIRYACNLPATEKMTPPEMADKLLQYSSDPGLVYTVNNYILERLGIKAPSVRLMHSTFDLPFGGGDLDFDIYNKLMVTFKINGCSIIRNQSYDISDLNRGICIDNSSDADATNNPLRPLLFIRPLHIRAGEATNSNWRRNKYSLVDIYQSSTQGVVVAFSKFQRVTETDDNTNGMVCKVEHIIEHAEGKDISIIFYKNQPNNYTVLVDGVFAFTENRAAVDPFPSTAYTHYILPEVVGLLAIGDVAYGTPGSSGYGGEDWQDIYVYGDSDRSYRMPFAYNDRFDIDYESVTIRYIK